MLGSDKPISRRSLLGLGWLLKSEPPQTPNPTTVPKAVPLITRRNVLIGGTVMAAAAILPPLSLGCQTPDMEWLHYEKGRSLYDQGFYREAITEFEAFVQSFLAGKSFAANQVADAQLTIATIYDKNLGLSSEAVSAYQKFWDLFSESPTVTEQRIIDAYPASQYRIGQLYEEVLGLWPEALAAYQKVVSKYPESESAPLAQFAIGTLYYHLNDYILSVKALELLFNSYPDSDLADSALYQAGAIYRYNLKTPQKALETYNTLLQNYPNSTFAAVTQLQIAAIYELDLKEYLKAVDAYRIFVNKYSNSEDVSLALIKIVQLYYEKLGDTENARITCLEILDRYTETNEKNPNIEQAIRYAKDVLREICGELQECRNGEPA